MVGVESCVLFFPQASGIPAWVEQAQVEKVNLNYLHPASPQALVEKRTTNPADSHPHKGIR
ncbi:hypothetical protein D3C76_672320 [compost metagenome]